jgi:putative ABC transport system permease protein
VGAIPMNGDDEQLFWIDGQPKPATDNDMNWAIDYIVGPDYLNVMGIPLLRGRFLSPQDTAHSAPVVVVDEVFARKYFPDQDAIGKHINVNHGVAKAEIVGVVGHVKQWGLDLDDSHSLRAQFYIPVLQMPDAFIGGGTPGFGMLVRSDGSVPEAAVFEALRQTSARMDNQQVIFGAETMDAIIADSMAQRRFSMMLLGTFAALALILSSIGIYGVISYLVARRTHEIGIRMALGANRAEVAQLILRDGMRLALAGIGIGVVCALGLTRLMANMLYGVSPTDPVTFVAISVLLLVVATAASYLPARRAMGVDPIVALRYD